jgi:hypothetical protein
MSGTVKGKVGAISKTGLGIMVDDKWYNLQDKDKQQKNGVAEKGDSVSFNWEKRTVKGRDSVVITSQIRIDAKAQKGGGGNYQGKGGKGNFGGKGGGWKEDPAKQASIVRQSCLGYAAQLVVAAIAKGAVKIEDAPDLVLKIAGEKFVPFAEQKVAQGSAEKAPEPKQDNFDDPVNEAGEAEFNEANGSGSDDFEDDIPF